MTRHKVQRLCTFRLYTSNCSNYELESWIATLIARNIQKLYLYYLGYKVTLPPCLFTCNTLLVDLSLGYCETIPMTVYLPALQKLLLRNVMYESDESIPRLLSGCPVLEELTIYRDNEDNMICCYISSPTLKRLLLTGRCFKDVEKKAYKVKLDTPVLRYLRLEDSVTRSFSAGGLTSLTEADVDFYSPMTLAYARSVLEFVSRLYNVKCLKLSTFKMKVPDSEFSALTIKFHNLTELKLNADWRFITKLLEKADNLQVLKIAMFKIDLNVWMDPKRVPACLASHLGTVRIDSFGYSEDEFSMVRYILRNSKVLKRMEIYPRDNRIDLKDKSEAHERISLFERACELVLQNLFYFCCTF
ncbi:putative F-box/FBD/LRR-repeat protein at5g22670 [Phtheirospermum japonicum]|uniref:Putative F-box/FBD/LRR-repeat protein at5g22670 n=1 Tax=Phtheirospermum japonicum TaxID=374723 RepID=A0A830BFL2_9LAMI|nr:putative F-box/FBD/LRR-repeat protein at5g22670 [Phtheirospermum japonicum]